MCFAQDALGRICLDILKDKWSPALQIRTVLLSVQALLSAPEPDDPLDARVADHFLHDRQAAEDRGARGSPLASLVYRKKSYWGALFTRPVMRPHSVDDDQPHACRWQPLGFVFSAPVERLVCERSRTHRRVKSWKRSLHSGAAAPERKCWAGVVHEEMRGVSLLREGKSFLACLARRLSRACAAIKGPLDEASSLALAADSPRFAPTHLPPPREAARRLHARVRGE